MPPAGNGDGGSWSGCGSSEVALSLQAEESTAAIARAHQATPGIPNSCNSQQEKTWSGQPKGLTAQPVDEMVNIPGVIKQPNFDLRLQHGLTAGAALLSTKGKGKDRSSRLSAESKPFIPQRPSFTTSNSTVRGDLGVTTFDHDGLKNELSHLQKTYFDPAACQLRPSTMHPSHNPRRVSTNFPMQKLFRYAHSSGQGENSATFPPSISYEQQYSETPALPTSNPIEPDLGGGLYASDANGFAQSMYPPQLNQSLSHQPVSSPLSTRSSQLTLFVSSNITYTRIWGL